METKKLVIKRYPNRKLYDTEQKQYITLEGIARLIRQGAEIEVIDNHSGEDLTALTLTQIILEQERKKDGLLSNSLLTSLIRAGEEGLSALQRGMKSSLSFWNQLDEEIKQRIQALVKKGELSAMEAEKLLEKLLEQSPLRREEQQEASLMSKIDPTGIEAYLNARQIPTQSDLHLLTQQLEMLSEKIEEVVQSRS